MTSRYPITDHHRPKLPICAYCQAQPATARTGSGSWPICQACWDAGADGYQPTDTNT